MEYKVHLDYDPSCQFDFQTSLNSLCPISTLVGLANGNFRNVFYMYVCILEVHAIVFWGHDPNDSYPSLYCACSILLIMFVVDDNGRDDR